MKVIEGKNKLEYVISGGMKQYACLTTDGRVRHVTDVMVPTGEMPSQNRRCDICESGAQLLPDFTVNL